jgi:hypothetical protein
MNEWNSQLPWGRVRKILYEFSRNLFIFRLLSLWLLHLDVQEEGDSVRHAPALISITPATPIGSQSREQLPQLEPEKNNSSCSSHSPPLQLSQSWTVFGQQQQTCSMEAEESNRAELSKSDSHLAALQPLARLL